MSNPALKGVPSTICKGRCHFYLKMATVLLVSFAFLLPNKTDGQQMANKQAEEKRPHSIKRAAIYSAVLPGLGQAYNRKYWKIPIVYAGFGVLGYFIVTNNNEYKKYNEAYIYKANDETYPIDNPYVDKYNLDQLQRGLDYYRRNRDLSIIITGLWYIVNVLEAYVDAHFFDYDISEDISLKVGPSVPVNFSPQPAVTPGIKVTLKF